MEILDQAVSKFNPTKIFAMFSGGHDSLVASYIASRYPGFSGCIHINTGIGIEETRLFVRETCKQYGWPLFEYKAADYQQESGKPDPQIYSQIVLENGFPGPPQHITMYSKLKEKPLSIAMREHKRKYFDKIILVTGARSQESHRRMLKIGDKPINQDGCRVWTSIIHDWSKRQVNEFLECKKICRNPVVEKLCMSGECLCGAFTHKGELKEISLWYPDAAEQIKILEKDVKQRFPWGWEDRPPDWWLLEKQGQQRLPLCWSCENKNLTSHPSDPQTSG